MYSIMRQELVASSIYNAIEDNQFRCLLTLLQDRNADPNYIIPDFGISPLHLAVGKDSKSFALDATTVLLQYGGNPNVRSVEGVTPVHIAAAWGRTQVLELLLQSGGNPWLTDEELKNAFDYAAEEHHWRTVRMLEQFHRLDSVKTDDWTDLCDPEPKFKLTRDKVLLYNREVAVQYQASAATVVNQCKSVGTQTVPRYSIMFPEFVSNHPHEPSHRAAFDHPKRYRNVCSQAGNSYNYYLDQVQTGKHQAARNQVQVLNLDVQYADVGVQAARQVESEYPRHGSTAAAAVGGKFDFVLADLRGNIASRVTLNAAGRKPPTKQRNLLTRFIGRCRGRHECLIDELRERQAAGLSGSGHLEQMSEVARATQVVEDEVMVEVSPGVATLSCEILTEETPSQEILPDETVPEETLPYEILPFETQPGKTLSHEILPETSLPYKTLPETPLPCKSLQEKMLDSDVKRQTVEPSHVFQGEVSVHVNPDPPDCANSLVFKVQTVPPNDKVAASSEPTTFCDVETPTDQYKGNIFLLDVLPVSEDMIHNAREESETFRRDLLHKSLISVERISVEPIAIGDTTEESEAFNRDLVHKSLISAEPILNGDATEENEAFLRDLLAKSIISDEPIENYEAHKENELYGVETLAKSVVLKEATLNHDATETSVAFRCDRAVGQTFEEECEESVRQSWEKQQCYSLITDVVETHNLSSSSDIQVVFENINDCSGISSFASSPMYYSCNEHSRSVLSYNDTQDLSDDPSSGSNALLKNSSVTNLGSNATSEMVAAKTNIVKTKFNESQLSLFSELDELPSASPPQDTDGSFVSASEDYIYTDTEEGVILLERRFLVPQTQSDSSGTSGPSSRSSSDGSAAYDTDSLIADLKKQGLVPGPIIPSTKRVYIKKLQRVARETPVAPLGDRPEYSCELERTLRSDNWRQDLSSYETLEREVAVQFTSVDPTRRWREGVIKSSFCYLLLDPRITCNLPCRADATPPTQVWASFLEAVFYVGKGKRSRPYSHLYQAVAVLKSGAEASDPKTRQILDIWRDGLGVVCLHVFQNVIPVEAYTREAAIIDALMLRNVRNACLGQYYGVAATWPAHLKKKLGVYLLHKALGIFVHEGERQLRPADIA